MEISKFMNSLLKDPIDIMKGIWKRCEPYVSDELFLKVQFRLAVGYWPNLKNPKSLNEKIQWLKLHTHFKEYSTLVDKYEVKKFVTKRIGKKYVIPTYGIYDSIGEIKWDELPNQFVLKSTSDSGGVIICKDKENFNILSAINTLKKCNKYNYYKYNKEYPYKDVSTRYIAEAYIEDESGCELKDYKFFCFEGEPKFLFVASGRQNGNLTFDFYDMEWNYINVSNGHPQYGNKYRKPKVFVEMVDICRELSKNINFVRVDLYVDKNDNIYFGELTFFHCSGVNPFDPIKYDYLFGSYLKLPNTCK